MPRLIHPGLLKSFIYIVLILPIILSVFFYPLNDFRWSDQQTPKSIADYGNYQTPINKTLHYPQVVQSIGVLMNNTLHDSEELTIFNYFQKKDVNLLINDLSKSHHLDRSLLYWLQTKHDESSYQSRSSVVGMWKDILGYLLNIQFEKNKNQENNHSPFSTLNRQVMTNNMISYDNAKKWLTRDGFKNFRQVQSSAALLFPKSGRAGLPPEVDKYFAEVFSGNGLYRKHTLWWTVEKLVKKYEVKTEKSETQKAKAMAKIIIKFLNKDGLNDQKEGWVLEVLDKAKKAKVMNRLLTQLKSSQIKNSNALEQMIIQWDKNPNNSDKNHLIIAITVMLYNNDIKQKNTEPMIKAISKKFGEAHMKTQRFLAAIVVANGIDGLSKETKKVLETVLKVRKGTAQENQFINQSRQLLGLESY